MRAEHEYYLSIDKCPSHGFYAVSIDRHDADGGGIGTRLTPGKCCGRWESVRKWKLSARSWKDMIEEASLALEAVEAEEQANG